VSLCNRLKPHSTALCSERGGDGPWPLPPGCIPGPPRPFMPFGPRRDLLKAVASRRPLYLAGARLDLASVFTIPLLGIRDQPPPWLRAPPRIQAGACRIAAAFVMPPGGAPAERHCSRPSRGLDRRRQKPGLATPGCPIPTTPPPKGHESGLHARQAECQDRYPRIARSAVADLGSGFRCGGAWADARR
jgi:hypothetical protein